MLISLVIKLSLIYHQLNSLKEFRLIIQNVKSGFFPVSCVFIMAR